MTRLSAALTRDQYLTILASFGIPIPTDTKLHNDELKKRLNEILNVSQGISHFIANPPLDPTATLAQPWMPTTSDSRLANAFFKSNLKEGFSHNTTDYGDREQVLSRPQLFMNLRKAISLALTLFDEHGQATVFICDPSTQDTGILIKFLSTFKLNAEIPLVTLMFQPFGKETTGWLDEALFPAITRARSISLGLLEQKLLLYILRKNTHMLSRSFVDSIERSSPLESDFQVTFLLPLAPLDGHSLGKFSSHGYGCVVCGQPTKSRCAGCQSASYCGKDCQKQHWPVHKADCKMHSLKNGNWRKVPLSAGFGPLGKDATITSLLNFNSVGSHAPSKATKLDTSNAPPNIHGDNLFLVKIQSGMGGDPPPPMLIYDRQRSFSLTFSRSKDQLTFDEILTEMRRGGVAGGLKMYRWAKRTGDWELSVCIDKTPTGQIVW